jgi:TolA-binding protein
MNADHHASRPRRLNPRVKPLSNGPPQLSPIDRIISLHHGSTTAIEATPQRLQESKQYPIPSLPERIEQLQKQNSSLNHEVAYYREMEQYRKEFEHEVARVKEKLENALSKLARSQQRVGDEWTQLRQGNSAHVQNNVKFT